MVTFDVWFRERKGTINIINSEGEVVAGVTPEMFDYEEVKQMPEKELKDFVLDNFDLVPLDKEQCIQEYFPEIDCKYLFDINLANEVCPRCWEENLTK